MIDDERRRLYGRPAPGAEAVLLSVPAPAHPPAQEETRAAAPKAEPAPDLAAHDEASAVEAATSVAEPSPASPRRRWLLPAIAAAAVLIPGVGALGVTMVSAAPSGPPSLAVFDRDPTAAERDAEELAGSTSAGIGVGVGSSGDLQLRRILQYGDGEGDASREIWAARFTVGDLGGQSFTVICLMTEPTGMTSGPLACMEEHDVARRGFIPLDQQRPAVVVDGERRVIEWGPRGDARLIDPPTPPRDGEGS